MPAIQEHLTKAAHNEQFVKTLTSDTTRFLDWAITGVCYSALHHVDAYLATRGIHPKRHSARSGKPGRNDYVRWFLRPIYEGYRDLDDLSRAARYTPKQFSFKDVQDCLEILQHIHQYVQSHLL